MTDIVERLRENPLNLPAGFVGIQYEAADEIERLREALKPFFKNSDMSEDEAIAYQVSVGNMRIRLHKQADEIERLREALSTLAKHCNEMEAQNHDYHTMGEGGFPCLSEPLARAYAVLGESDEA